MLWEFEWKTEYDINSSSPIVTGPNQFVIASGYDHGTALVEVAMDGSTKAIWQNKKLKTKFSTAILHEGYGTNLLAEFSIAKGDVALALSNAPHRLIKRLKTRPI